MVQRASEVLSSLNAAQDEFPVARRVSVAAAVVIAVAVMNFAAVLTMLAQG